MKDRRNGLVPVLKALRFGDRDPQPLRAIRHAHWPTLLGQTDRARLTLALGVRCRDWLPDSVRDRIDRDLARNTERRRLWSAAQSEISASLAARGVEFLVLKGATHWPYFCDDPCHRPQYDLDVFCQPPQLEDARRVVSELGFEPVHGRAHVPTDHLPSMIRRTGWQWRGDYFDPEFPPTLELHFRFWSPGTEWIDVDGLEGFWARRTVRDAGGLPVPALSLPDTLSFACLHVLRHLLHGDVLPYHVYELAHFLERSSDDTDFWNAWAETTSASFRAIQAIAFRLAVEWFQCRVPAAAREGLDALPPGVTAWFRLFTFSPLTTLDRPNRHELLLHLHLVNRGASRRSILMRRLLPRPQRVRLAPHVRSDTLLWKARRRLYQVGFVTSRTFRHLRSLLALGYGAWRWRYYQMRSSRALQ
jgi:hypothetical protein